MNIKDAVTRGNIKRNEIRAKENKEWAEREAKFAQENLEYAQRQFANLEALVEAAVTRGEDSLCLKRHHRAGEDLPELVKMCKDAGLPTFWRFSEYDQTGKPDGRKRHVDWFLAW